MPFLGSQPADQYQSLAKQTITGDGSTAYALNRSVTNAYDMEVFINNVRQEPDISYTASGNTITFTAAVTASDSCYLIYQGQSVGSINPPANSVGGTQIQNTAITDAKLHSSLDLSSKTLTMPAGHVIQVQSTHTTTGISTTAAETDFISVNITPKSNTSKILIQGHVSTVSNVNHINVKLYRNSVHIGHGTSGSTMNGIISGELDNNNFGGNGNASFGAGGLSYLDSPATTSTITYKLALYQPGGGGSTLYINRSPSGYQGSSTNLTVMEIAQ